MKTYRFLLTEQIRIRQALKTFLGTTIHPPCAEQRFFASMFFFLPGKKSHCSESSQNMFGFPSSIN